MVFLYQEEAYIARVKELEEVTESRNQKRKEQLVRANVRLLSRQFTLQLGKVVKFNPKNATVKQHRFHFTI